MHIALVLHGFGSGPDDFRTMTAHILDDPTPDGQRAFLDGLARQSQKAIAPHLVLTNVIELGALPELTPLPINILEILASRTSVYRPHIEAWLTTLVRAAYYKGDRIISKAVVTEA